MTKEKIQSIVDLYRQRFEAQGILPMRMDTSKSVSEITREERLAHAHFLLDGIVEFSNKPDKEGKTGRHLGFLQAILSFEGWYTLDDLRGHNRSDES